ncbi:MAG: hypothetical protein KJ659_06115 [Actinobacteria bacterium]|nr:hypothetical protein [Actinomycetota bacterium]MBU1609342.1 hypothetical protein [Actinomycetota bacterium]MBU2314974.1 hypothetical protein [Actinomycetota bacterium]MBU2385060.1 hypothetical protein [Actinomycetota bacterium]
MNSKRRMLTASVVLGGLVALNLAQFVSVEESRPPQWRAITLNPTGDLIELGQSQNGNVRGWYSLHVALGTSAPDAQIVLPRGGSYFADRTIASLYGFGQAASVEVRDYPFEYDADTAPLTDQGIAALRGDGSPVTRLEGPGRTGFDQWIILIDEGGSTGERAFTGLDVLLDDVAHFVLVDRRLLIEHSAWEG